MNNIEMLEDYIEALRKPKPFKYTNEQKANAIENLIKEYKELKNKCNEIKIKKRIEELQQTCQDCHFRGSICKDFKTFNQCTVQLTLKNLQELLEGE